jgi:RNase H-like domain found in reverse transcriptase/Reverse transcriptase (RNA-dependent DNA polymerase)
MILGHLWLRTFNPQINWTKGNLQGKLEVSTTATKQQIGQAHTPLAQRLTTDPEKRHCTTITTLQEAETYIHLVTQRTDIHTVPTEQIRKTTIAQQMSKRAYDQAKLNTEQMIPIEYQRHAKVFLETEATRFPPPRPWDHQIKLTNDAPTTINGKVYPLPTKLTEALNKWIDDMLERGFISLSDSSYGSPTFTVTKKDGSQRVIQDFRELNKYTVKDITPLPNIKQAIEGLGDKVLFSKFDIQEGYNNIQIVPKDCWKMAFKTHRGLFEFNVMPFGLCNAPGTFSRGLGNDVQPMYKEFPTNRFKHYMDDCIISMKEGEEDLHKHMTHRLLEIFKQHSYFLKLAKCEFEQTSTTFLGVQLGNGEITMDPSKITGITDWPETLATVKDIRSTLGVFGFQRPFIRGFAQIAKPLTDLLKKDTSFEWTNKCTTAVKELKWIVTSEPVLVPPDSTRQFILEVDTSQYATGAILYQADLKLKDKKGNLILRPCRYHAKTFSGTEQNYPIYNREYMAIMRGLKHWDHLLQGPKDHKTIVITNHANLQYYRHPHKIGSCISRYIAKQEEYPITLMYKPGVTNRANSLSRRPDFAPDMSRPSPHYHVARTVYRPLVIIVVAVPVLRPS